MASPSPNARPWRISQPGRVVLTSWAYDRVGDTLVLCTEGMGDAHEADVDGWLARLTRTVMKAMEWLMRDAHMRAFPPDDVPGALRWLESEAPTAMVTEAIAVLTAALRVNAQRRMAQRAPGPPSD